MPDPAPSAPAPGLAPGGAPPAQDQYSRTRMLLGEQALRRLRSARVAVFGLGGVGGYAVEALARSGVGALELVDDDTVSLSNLNRQLLATHATLGRCKVDVAAERVADIDPGIEVRVHKLFYTPATQAQLDLRGLDYVVDAIDTVAGKIALALQAQQAGVPLISCMGAGNRMDPAALRVADLYSTSGCPLARVMRRELRRRGVQRLKVVYSPEPPMAPRGAWAGPCPDATPGRPGRACSAPPGSNAFVPAAAGLLLAAEVVRDLTGVRGATG